MVPFRSVPAHPKKPPDPDETCEEECEFEKSVELHCETPTSCDAAPKSETTVGWSVRGTRAKPPDPSGDCDQEIVSGRDVSAKAVLKCDSEEETPTAPRYSNTSTRATVGEHLEVEISDELCQGVGLDSLLERFGDQIDKTSVVRTSSHQVSRYTAFISHDWETNRYMKVLSLIWVYNRVPAAGFAFVACIMSAVLETAFAPWADDECSLFEVGGVPLCAHHAKSAWPISMLVFAIILCCWQRIRASCGKSQAVFFDKLCIAQSDAALKKQAIRGLAGFLRRSGTLVVLWSPIYFSRLWCTYELATWLTFMRKSVVVMPVSMALTMFLLVTTVFGLILVSYITVLTSQVTLGNYAYGFLAAAGIFLVTLTSVAAERLNAELAKLPAQLNEFSIRNAKCSCCQMNLVDPESGTPMVCDRALVFATLATWSEEGDDSVGDKYLDDFDVTIKSGWRPELLKLLQGSSLQYNLFLCSVTPIVLCYCVGTFFPYLYLGPVVAARLLLEFSGLACCIFPIGCRLTTAAGITETFGFRLPWWIRVLSRAAISVIWYMVAWSANLRFRQMRSPLPQLIYTVVLSVVTHFAFWPDRWRRVLRRVGR